MALLHSTLLNHGSTSLYFTLLYQQLYFTQRALLPSTIALLHYTWPYIHLPGIYFTLHYSTMAPLCCTLLYITRPWLYTSFYFTLLYHGSTSLYFTLLYQQLYFTQVDSIAFYHSTTLDPTVTCQVSSYFTLHYSTMALLYSTLLYIPWIYIILPWLYFVLLHSLFFNSNTSLPLGSTSLYQFVLTLPTLISPTYILPTNVYHFIYMWYDLEGLSRDMIDNTGWLSST